MYLVFAEKADEYAKIKATLGANTQRVNTRHSIFDSLQADPAIQIVIVAPSIKGELAFGIAEDLRIQFPHVDLILIRSRIDVPVLTAALESGIRDVVDAQDAASLMSAVKRSESIAERLNERGEQSQSHLQRGKTVTVYSAKGGCGKTTLASNLAAALADKPSTRVCLVDLDLQFGDIATTLRIQPSKTISNAKEMGDSIDIEGLVKVLLNYEDKFDVLLAPLNPSDIETLSANFISRILSTLQRNYDFVVIDTAPSLTEVMVQVLQESDLVLLVTTLDMPAIKNLRLAISALDALGLEKRRRRLILNKSDLKAGLDKSDVEELIGEEISNEIPSNIKVSSSTNDGRLILYAHPNNPVSRAIYELAEDVSAIADELTRIKVA